MAISFETVPADILVPWTYIEISNENAVQASSAQPYKVLLIGQRLAAGTAAPLTPVPLTGPAQSRQLFGAGSMLAHMCEAYFRNNPTTETVAIALDDNPAGVNATGSIAFAATSVEAGTEFLYVGGRAVTFGVDAGATAAEIATACAAAITASTDFPVTATAATNTVTLTCKWAGETGNSLDVRFNARAGENHAAGVVPTVTAMSGGTGNPDLTPALAALGDTQYNVLAVPFLDAANLSVLDAELLDRWGPLRQNEGFAIMSAAGSHAALGTLGDSLNSPFFCLHGVFGSPTPPHEFAAAIAGQVAFYAQIDPARPFRTLELRGVIAPDESDRFTVRERDLLLKDGISTTDVAPGSRVTLERLVTTYKLDPFGEPDRSFRNLSVVLTLSLLRYETRTTILRKWPRHKLGDDGTRYAQGQAIVTPSVIRAELVALVRAWEFRGLIEQADAFAKSLIVERNAADQDRVDILMAPNLINQFLVAGVKIAYIL